ncbi:hypothetical protein [Enterococcus pingfangensis]
MDKLRIRTFILFLFGGLLLSISRLALAVIATLPTSQNFSEWLSNSKTLLIIADEILAFAIILLGTAIILIIQQNFQRTPIRSAIFGISFLAAIFGWISVTLDLGRIVYPVNGLNVITTQLPIYLSQIYGALHFSDLALGVGTITLASMSMNEHRKIFLSGIIIGFLQVVGTYYGLPVIKSLIILSNLSWLAWTIIYSLIQIKKIRIPVSDDY